jgi:nucleoside-diphosphate-sugar epimerase/putative sterol carrier protein
VKVAVTGAAGQLGTVVLRRLAAERAVTALRSLDLRPPIVASGKLEHVTADVRDPDFARHLDGCDAVVHLAFIVTGHPPRHVFDAVNVGGSRNVFAAAARAGVRQIVYASSVAAYGVVPGHPTPIVETTPRVYQREFAYSSAKFEVEQFLDEEFEPRHPEIAVARFRPGIFFGAPTVHAFGRLLDLRLLLDGPPLPVVWDEDVAEAMALALRAQARGAFNLVAEPPTATVEIARACGLRLIRVPELAMSAAVAAAELAARLGNQSIDPAWLRSGLARLIVSADKARRELGWQPRCPTPTSVIERYLAERSLALDPRLELFFRFVQLGTRAQRLEEGRHMQARVHLRLTGPGGGDLGLLVDGGKLSVRREAPRPPTVTVTMKATTLRDLLAGRIEFTTAQLTGKIRVDGEALAALVVQALIGTFRQRTPKRLQRLMFKGAEA